jgi:hypothetical protein
MDAQISAEFAFDVVETNLKLSKRDRNKTVAPSATQKQFLYRNFRKTNTSAGCLSRRQQRKWKAAE